MAFITKTFRMIAILLIAVYFLTGGVMHFLKPDLFVAIMPPYLPNHLELVWASGLFEIFGAIGILIPRTRFLAGYGLMALTLAVSPANVHMAMNPHLFPDVPVTMLYLRLALQLFLLWLIWFAFGGVRSANKEADAPDANFYGSEN